MKSRDYELLIQAIFQQILDQDRVPNIRVEHDVVKQGVKAKHQIDVYWEFELGGIIYPTVVQGKNWAKPVDQGEILKFESVLNDLPGQPRGVIVTARGYQEGALKLAKSCGIQIYELKQDVSPPLVLTYTGWARFSIKGYQKTAFGQPFGLVVETEIFTPEFSNLVLEVDSASVGGNLPALTSMGQAQHLPHEIEFYDAEGRFLRTLRDIYHELATEIAGRGELFARPKYSFDGATFVKIPSKSCLIKANSLSVEATLKVERRERLWPAKNVAIFILSSLKDGKVLQFAKVPLNTAPA